MEVILEEVLRKGDFVNSFASALQHLDHQRGDVVASGGLEGGVDEVVGDGLGRGLGGGSEKLLGDLAVEEALGEAIGAEEEEVAGLEIDGADLGADELVIGAERFLQGGAAGVVAGFALGELAIAAEPADVGIVVGDLAQGAGSALEVVDAAIADVAKVEPLRGEPAEAEGGAHAEALLRVAAAEVLEGGIDLSEELLEDLDEAGLDAGDILAERTRQEL